MALGNKLMTLRKQNKLTQEKIADELSVTRQTISNWELDQTKPDIDQIKRLSKLYNISVDELIDNDVKELLTEKISNVEKLTGLVYKILKGLLILIVVFIALLIIGKLFFSTTVSVHGSTGINCKLNGKNYSIKITSESPRVTSIFKKNIYDYDNIPITNITILPYISIPDIEKYQKEYQVINVVFNYFELKGGSCY